ncbi:MAG: hypothetical protein A3G09_01045 [Candidatus Moranbacteria bacterium RIFCSPLOWO2_12_FULL_48_12]|nr:MAG: hypothetical protein A3G09_01045 [Candidatus Moranbacteria bacterium RIFCSPLOWO2_12_FULL_48_12]
MKHFDKKDYEFLGRWVAPTLAWSMGYRWTEGALLKELGIEMQGDILVLDGNAFFIKEARQGIERVLTEHVSPLDYAYFNKYTLMSDVVITDFLKLSESLNDQHSTAKDKLSLFFIKYEGLWPQWLSVFFVSDFFEKEIRKLAHQYSLEEEKVLASIVTSRKNFSTESKEEMLEIQSYVQEHNSVSLLELKNIEIIRGSDKVLAKSIDDFIKKYEWIGTHHFWGAPLTYDRFFEEISNLKTEGVIKQKQKYADCPADLAFLLKIAGDLSWMRTQTAEASAKVAFAFRPILSQAGSALKITYDDLIWLSHREILDGLNGSRIISQDVTDARQKAYGAHLTPEKIEIFEGDRLKQLSDIFIPKSLRAKVVEISGTVASRGYAKGGAHIVIVPHKVADFERGEILIAPETTPDYVPLMKKAGAVVTDIGGITSHAAIVSRELGIPCVVGTKIATQVLKDGDVVEVDAEKGIVTIIK